MKTISSIMWGAGVLLFAFLGQPEWASGQGLHGACASGGATGETHTHFQGGVAGPAVDLDAEDWSSLQAAHRAQGLNVRQVGAEFQCQNPGQGWTLRFDGGGIAVEPRSLQWSWGLALRSYGFANAPVSPASQPLGRAEGNRMQYDWGGGLQEWYVNRAGGLEHGFTLQSRPQGAVCDSGPLTVSLAIQGGLMARPMLDGKGMRFVNAREETVLTYSGLYVYDARGAAQPARMLCRTGELLILIDEASAQYPLTIDPIVQGAYLKASNTEALDAFGSSVSLSGDRVVVGAIGEDSDATGENGDQNNNLSTGSGAVYVFERVAGGWVQTAYLKASGTGAGDGFGASVATDGDRIVVGAPGEDSDANTLNGDESNNAAIDSGAAYVFQLIGGSWRQVVYLKADNSGAGDRFGSSVAISGELVLVGAQFEDSDSRGVNGNGHNDSAVDSGACYVFRGVGGVWWQEAYLKSTWSRGLNRFGSSVALSGDRAVIGALGESSSSTGVDGNQSIGGSFRSGAAFVFERTAGVWSQQVYLKASNTQASDEFGFSVDVDGDLVVVGAREEDSSSGGVDGDDSDNSAPAAGAAYVFGKAGGTWVQEAYLKAAHPDTLDQFGFSVATSADRILVGAILERSSSSGVNGDQTDNSASTQGAAYLFERSAGTWVQSAYIKSSNPDPIGADDRFGNKLAISGSRAVIAALTEDGSGVGVNPDGTSNDASNSGAAYIFELDAPMGVYCGIANINSTGFPAQIAGSGSLAIVDNAFTLHATGLPARQFGLFLNSMGQAYIANPGGSQGVLCLGGGSNFGRHNRFHEIRFSGVSGAVQLTLDLMDVPTAFGIVAIAAGETWNFQYWHRDQNPSNASNFTNALSVQFH